MLWLFGQTWIWYLIAFAVGVLVAWLLFVLPAQRRLRAAQAAAASSVGTDERTSLLDRGPGGDDSERTTVVDPSVADRTQADEPPTEQFPAVDSALALLDTRAAGLPIAEATAQIPIVGAADATTQIPVVEPEGEKTEKAESEAAAVTTAIPLVKTDRRDSETADGAGAKSGEKTGEKTEGKAAEAAGGTAAEGAHTAAEAAVVDTEAARVEAESSEPGGVADAAAATTVIATGATATAGESEADAGEAPKTTADTTADTADADGATTAIDAGAAEGATTVIATGAAAGSTATDGTVTDGTATDGTATDGTAAEGGAAETTTAIDTSEARGNGAGDETAAVAATATVEAPYGPGSAKPNPDGSAPGPEFTIKGNANSMLYHTPDSPYYARTRAEAWFSSTEAAEAAGFAPWNRRRSGENGNS
ncbi:hypothetical protein SAMN05443637_101373 [Pseudonocardia thermophila]|uniref:Membrane protein ArfC n=1 Tax=Pseudonocardia thermophila TaxID=1848 RepID=A0A1M6NP06_PSETH|nr:hypothetical protein [Pseudonocardia thermophila]SHJ97425.1 hypothetical protein SAMN05443637_101373 [Pseudonocardia thermophila]